MGPARGAARSAGRWAGLAGAAFVAAAVTLVNPTAAPVASAFDCPDVEVIFARGTNEPPVSAASVTPLSTRCASRPAA